MKTGLASVDVPVVCPGLLECGSAIEDIGHDHALVNSCVQQLSHVATVESPIRGLMHQIPQNPAWNIIPHIETPLIRPCSQYQREGSTPLEPFYHFKHYSTLITSSFPPGMWVPSQRLYTVRRGGGFKTALAFLGRNNLEFDLL